MQRKYQDNNIFLKIINNEIPSEKIYEDNRVLCFKDINPKAPTHILLVPKSKYVSFDDFAINATDEEISYFFRIAQKIAHDMKLKSYRIVANCGEGAGQVVFHYHLHIMGYND